MGKIKSFGLSRGTRVGNYQVLECIGRGWEAEAYKVREIPTDALRVLKLFRVAELESVRDFIHCAWFFEQVRCTGHFPIYHHYGQLFLGDDEGCLYMIFEYISGQPLARLGRNGGSCARRERLFFRLASAVADVHDREYAIGDFSTLDNVLVTAERIVFVDCDRGKPDHPNRDFSTDCKHELIPAAKRIFGTRTMSKRAMSLAKKIKGTKTFRKETLRVLLQEVGIS